MGTTTPSISVVVPTRNRPTHAAACVRSILRNDGFLSLIVVDQSDDDATEVALAEVHDARLSYLQSTSRGVSNARNLGIELCSSTYVAFTDDDCRVAPDWIARLLAILRADDAVAVVCGRVVVPVELRGLGFAESFEPRTRVWRGRYPPFGSDWGITANMTIRREVLLRLGQFDPMLGAGAPLRLYGGAAGRGTC